MSRWPSVEAQLVAFGTDLDALAQALRRNAGGQDVTSGNESVTGPRGVPVGPLGPLGPSPLGPEAPPAAPPRRTGRSSTASTTA